MCDHGADEVTGGVAGWALLPMAAIDRSLGAMRPTVEHGFLVDVEESDGEASIVGDHQAEGQEIQCPIERNVSY